MYLILLLLILGLFFGYWQKKRTFFYIKRWEKSLNLKKHRLIFQELYQQVNGFKLSNQARQKHNAIEYTYGEIEFLPFIALLSLVKPDRKTIFYDLGSGTGKAVLACAMVYPIYKSIGIELMPELYLESCKQAKLLATIPDYEEKAQKIAFIQGDFLEINLNEATLIFINASTFIGVLWQNLCNQLNNLTNIKHIITTSKPLKAANFLLQKSSKIQVSWGIVDVYIHVRKTNFD